MDDWGGKPTIFGNIPRKQLHQTPQNPGCGYHQVQISNETSKLMDETSSLGFVDGRESWNWKLYDHGHVNLSTPPPNL